MLDLLLFGVEETSVRRACTQPAQQNGAGRQRAAKRHLRAQGELQEGIQGPKKGYLGFTLIWRKRDECPTRLRAACAANRRWMPARGKASL